MSDSASQILIAQLEAQLSAAQAQKERLSELLLERLGSEKKELLAELRELVVPEKHKEKVWELLREQSVDVEETESEKDLDPEEEGISEDEAEDRGESRKQRQYIETLQDLETRLTTEILEDLKTVNETNLNFLVDKYRQVAERAGTAGDAARRILRFQKFRFATYFELMEKLRVLPVSENLERSAPSVTVKSSSGALIEVFLSDLLPILEDVIPQERFDVLMLYLLVRAGASELQKDLVLTLSLEVELLIPELKKLWGMDPLISTLEELPFLNEMFRLRIDWKNQTFTMSPVGAGPMGSGSSL